MEHLILLEDWAVVMAVSAFAVILCHKAGLPTVLGYILAGIIIGPHTPPHLLVSDMSSINIFTDLGIILLLFSLGLDFSLKKIFRSGFKVLFATLFKTLFMTGTGFAVGSAFGWNRMDSIFLGAILSISSTAIVAKVLIDTRRMKENSSEVMLGILIVEDFFAILIITMLSSLASHTPLTLTTAGISILKGTAFIAGLLLAGTLLVPRLLRLVARVDISEMLIVTVLGLCFGAAILAVKFGFSVALGAFLIGAIVAETEEAQKIIHKMEPIRDMFIAFFFVSVGLLINPDLLLEYAGPILIIALIVIPAKFLTCYVSGRLAGYNSKTSLGIGLGLAQIGEFSFIIAQLGDDKDVTSPFLYVIAVAVAVITTVTTPILIRETPAITAFFDRFRRGPKPANS